MAREEEVRIMAECLRELPERTRRVVKLRHAGGHSWIESRDLRLVIVPNWDYG